MHRLADNRISRALLHRFKFTWLLHNKSYIRPSAFRGWLGEYLINTFHRKNLLVINELKAFRIMASKHVIALSVFVHVMQHERKDNTPPETICQYGYLPIQQDKHDHKPGDGVMAPHRSAFALSLLSRKPGL